MVFLRPLAAAVAAALLLPACALEGSPSEASITPLAHEGVDDLSVFGRLDPREIEIRVWLTPRAESDVPVAADVSITSPDGRHRVEEVTEWSRDEDQGFIALTVPLEPALPWHPDHPNLHALSVSFRDAGGRVVAAGAQRFGLRTLATRDAGFVVNGEPFYVRACAGEGGCGCDDLSREEVETRLRAMRRFGFNTVRHHSHVPTDEYLSVADEVGIFVQIEIQGHIGTDPEGETFADSRRAWVEMVERGRRHPSVFIYGMGNEIYRNDPGLIACQDILYDLAKAMDPSVLVLNRSGSSPFNDAVGRYDLIERPIGEYEHTGPFARDAFDLYLRGDRRGRSDEVPIIAHEYPLVASFPNPELADIYDEMPAWLTTTIENARANGQEHLLPLYVANSERIQAICRREMLEEARRWPELDGYSMLRFTDCGAYVSGVVNDAAEPKNITAEEFLRSNGETVLLCDWNERSFAYGETLEAKVEISHHGIEPFTADECEWWLMEGPRVIDEGTFDGVLVGPVDVAEIGRLAVSIPELPAPTRLTLRVLIPDSQPRIMNEWHFWAFPEDPIPAAQQRGITLWDPRDRMETYLSVYPEFERITDPDWTLGAALPDLLITDSWQPAFTDFVAEGGNLWVISDKTWPWPEEIGIFGLHITHFVPEHQAPVVFPELDELCNKWLTICSNSPSRRGNSGTVVWGHPALGDFPHEGFCDLQFWPMIYRAKVLQLDRFPEGTEPIIRAIDNYTRLQNKGYLLDLALGEGSLFLSTLNMAQFFESSIATRHLFDQNLRYLLGGERVPSAAMTPGALDEMITDFAEEHATLEPLTHDEMPARYTTRWRALLDPRELVILEMTTAEGIDEARLGVHFEYAQTQWFLDAAAGDEITWTFETETPGSFEGTVFAATPHEGVSLRAQIDDHPPREVTLPGGGAWEDFGPVVWTIHDLPSGEHTLRLTAGGPAGERLVQIRGAELRAQEQP